MPNSKQHPVKILILAGLFLIFHTNAFSQNSKRWALNAGRGITWITNGKAHADHIEMSGLQVSAIVNYGIAENGELILKKKLVYPMLRTIPNNTHASLIKDFNDYKQLAISVDNQNVIEYPQSFATKGNLVIISKTNTAVQVTRTLFPSVNKAALLEVIELKNTGNTITTVNISNNIPVIETDAAKGVYGQYIVKAQTTDDGQHQIIPFGIFSFTIAYSGRKSSDEEYYFDGSYEQNKRTQFVNEVFNNLVLETPNDTINREFAFAKLRTTESIFDTKGGLMHGPGGGAYYAAIWANDQAEYANPFFPFLGNLNGNESAMNSYRMFAGYMNPEYKPIPSSIIAEGTDMWNGAGDRGDMAMIAYGASRFAMATGDKATAERLWPLIKWCLGYLERQKTPEGVIKSNSDELEGRFPAGKVNLSTNSLAYGAYISAANLGEALGDKHARPEYGFAARRLREAIEKYFGATVQGFKTYRYYDGNDKLRSWICLPLVMGITERKEETIKALFSPLLWTYNGILTEAGDKTFWDRSTLYAFRGLFANGATAKCMPYFSYYSAMRLTGEHVPYPVEAWPEGGQRHLAAESALYCRIITEGIFGINPTGLNSFTISPWLPNGWNYMRLKNVKAFNNTFDIEVTRRGASELVKLKLQNGKVIEKVWDKKGVLGFSLM